MIGERLLIRGQVQGVGFRPAVWRIACEMGLDGDVRNTSEGVEVRLWGEETSKFEERLLSELPGLAKVDTIESVPLEIEAPNGFSILNSSEGTMQVNITPDAATCSDCLDEIRDPFANRYRYPFTNCTNCGPRFSIIEKAPYDRNNTTMNPFDMCCICDHEYTDPNDRRFHAQPIACHACGPRTWLEHLNGGTVNCEAFSMMDDVDAAGGALMNGHILAVKGLGGFHLACDATKPELVQSLRDKKRRPSKAFALMARDVDVIKRYARISDKELELLNLPAAPIVLLEMHGEELPDAVAPGLNHLGFMLPHTPMHHLMLRRMKRPVVMTSGNISGEPQCTSNEEAREQLSGVAEFALFHDRNIANRIDDSVIRLVSDQVQVLRRARGYAPANTSLPPSFPNDLQVLAMGGELKNTFCIVKNDQIILSQHMGDLQNLKTTEEVNHNLNLYQDLYEHTPDVFAIDGHPEYHSSKHGRILAADKPVVEVQHHHAHIASCLADNNRALDASPVLGIAMDGLGLGDDGTIWGGEFLACDYRGYRRLGCLKPVPLLGGDMATREPWRNLYAHLVAEMGWAEFAMNFPDLDVFTKLVSKPRATLDGMIVNGTNSPLSSSCGRLFDAAAALTGLCWEEQSYESEAAMAFEAALDPAALEEPDDLAYPFSIPLLKSNGLPYIEPVSVWRAILGDLILKTPIGTISARFHRGLAKAIIAMSIKLTQANEIDTVALSGGCFQNTILTNLVKTGLERAELNVLTHSAVPANDGGLALGQAMIAMAVHQKGRKLCA